MCAAVQESDKPRAMPPNRNCIECILCSPAQPPQFGQPKLWNTSGAASAPRRLSRRSSRATSALHAVLHNRLPVNLAQLLALLTDPEFSTSGRTWAIVSMNLTYVLGSGSIDHCS